MFLFCSPPAGCGEQSIFTPVRGGASPGGAIFRLRDGVLFHMFASSSPCGDARLNCPYENTVTSETFDDTYNCDDDDVDVNSDGGDVDDDDNDH